jgi:GxxExxY protein
LGPGLLESAYQKALTHELQKIGFQIERQKPVHLIYEGADLGEAVRLDLLVERKLVVELKSVDELAPVHGKQVLTPLRLGNWKLGLLINFGQNHLKDGIKRIVNQLPRIKNQKPLRPSRLYVRHFPSPFPYEYRNPLSP